MTTQFSPPTHSTSHHASSSSSDNNTTTNHPATGTTLVGIVCPQQGVVLGCDSRVSMGSYVSNRVSDKLSQLTDHVIIAQSGSAADAEMVASIVKHQLEQLSIQSGRPVLVKTAAHILSSISYKYKDSLAASAIVAGWDPTNGFSIYSISSSGMCLKVPFATSGSGSWFIYGWLDSNFKSNAPQTLEQARTFVQTAVSHAMARDGSSGGIIRTATVTAEGITREFIPGNALPFGPTAY